MPLRFAGRRDQAHDGCRRVEQEVSSVVCSDQVSFEPDKWEDPLQCASLQLWRRSFLWESDHYIS